MKKILFICTGNTCRSPMAYTLFSSALREQKMLQQEYTAESGGLNAFDGEPASAHAVRVMNELGLDLSAHRSKRISKNAINEAYLVLTMTREQKEYIIRSYPETRDKVFTLREFAAGDERLRCVGRDISDPYGGTLESYRECVREMDEQIKQLVKKLKSF